MLRHKTILTFVSLVLLGVLTFVDTRSCFLETEELIESREVEREDLKEELEVRDSVKLLLEGGLGCSPFGSNLIVLRAIDTLVLRNARQRSLLLHKSTPLFIVYSCLRVDLA